MKTSSNETSLMVNFLVLVDNEGSIIEIKWCYPLDLIHEKVNFIQEIFDPKQRDLITNILPICGINTTKLSTLDNLSLMAIETSLKLRCIKSNNGIYILGFENRICNDLENADPFQNLISRFMFLIQMNDKNHGFRNSESTRFQFEEIQLLNNELVNTKRMLEKSNGQLNILNKDLNNRLVKDPLTGLVSRYQYRSEIEYQISKHHNALGVFMFIDIDDFKKINDTYGHGVGDDYLVEFASRLKKIPLQNSIKLRIAGDEFGLFVYGLKTVESSDLEAFWELIKHHILSDPFIIQGHTLFFSLSVGMAIYGVDTKEVYDIIEFADFAMYCAKRNGKNRYSRFDEIEYRKKKVLG